MQLPPASPLPDSGPWASHDILQITLRQLRTWGTAEPRHSVVQPQADEEAWEGTEIDVNRTVL